MGRLIDDVVDRVAIACGSSDAGRLGGVLSNGRQQVILGMSQRGCIYLAFKFMALVRLLGWWGLSPSSRRMRPMRGLALCDTEGPQIEAVALLGHRQGHYSSCGVCDGAMEP